MTAVLLLPILSGCGGADHPRAGDVEPVALDLAAPTYAFETADGLLVRSGDVQSIVPRMEQAEWLPGGTALLSGGKFSRSRVWDPETGELGREVPLADPNRSVSQINEITEAQYWTRPHKLTAYDLDGTSKWKIELPLTDNTEATDFDELERSYLSAHTIDGTTFLRWADGSEWYEGGDYGLLRIGPEGEILGNVQVNVPIIAVWLAADGAALLATKRVQGDPCGGCQVTQQLIEIDPDSGETIAEYDMPEEYDADWDVREVDKIGDRIAVRFAQAVHSESVQEPTHEIVQRGTWVLDDEGWSMVPGSDREISWWQGPEDRVVATPLPGPPGENSGYEFSFAWEHDGERTPLNGSTVADVPQRLSLDQVAIAGQALPPD